MWSLWAWTTVRASRENVCWLLVLVRAPRTWCRTRSAAAAAPWAQPQAEPRAHRRLDGGRGHLLHMTHLAFLIPLTPRYNIHNSPLKKRCSERPLIELLLTSFLIILSITDLDLLVPKSTVIVAGTWVTFYLILEQELGLPSDYCSL